MLLTRRASTSKDERPTHWAKASCHMPESNARRSDAVGVGISLVIPINTLLIANLSQ